MTDASRPPRVLATRAVHGPATPLPGAGPVVPPIYQTAPFRFGRLDALEEALADPALVGVYARWGNPTVAAAEARLAALEEAEEAVAFASGMAALAAAVLAWLPAGGRLLAAAELYGGSRSWLAWLAERHPDVDVEMVPADGLAGRLAGPGAPDLVLVESPTNPQLRCVDLRALAEGCRAAGARLVVDNTFATPVLQQPLALGADLVVHSATKFLGGHSDVSGGFVAGRAGAVAPVRRILRLAGPLLDPHAAFLVDRGMKTLVLRVERQSATAALLAARLADHPGVEAVLYPASDPVARRQMRGGGALVSFVVPGGTEGVRRFAERLRLVALIPSFGGVESGISPPALTSHRSLAPSEREALGISDGMVRLCCGIEDPEDLWRDLREALG